MRSSAFIRSLAVTFTLATFGSLSAEAAVLRVSPEGTAIGADCEEATANKGLQACLDKAEINSEADTIEIPAGDYVGKFNYTHVCLEDTRCSESSSLALVGIGRPMFRPGAAGNGLANLTVHSENGNQTVKIRGIDFDGSASQEIIKGISVELKETNLEMDDVRVWRFKNGGASIQATGADGINVSGSQFTGNSLVEGPGAAGLAITVSESQEPTDHTSIELSGNLVAENTSLGGAGGIGIAAANSTVKASNNLIYDNSSSAGRTTSGGGFGLALSGANSSALLVHNTVARNSAARGGGLALFLDKASQEVGIFNNIVFANQAGPNNGGDLLLGQDVAAGENPGSYKVFNNLYASLVSQCGTSCVQSDGNFVDPVSAETLFAEPGLNNFHLRLLSPAINTGLKTAPGIPPTDFDSKPRSDTAPDMGALEFEQIVGPEPTSSPIPTESPIATPPATPEATPDVTPEPTPNSTPPATPLPPSPSNPSGGDGADGDNDGDVGGGGCSLSNSVQNSAAGVSLFGLSILGLITMRRRTMKS